MTYHEAMTVARADMRDHIPDWRHSAECRDAEPTLFDDDTYLELARRYCQQCPVSADCLQDALELGGAGVRAGTTEAQRDDMLRARRRDANPRVLLPATVTRRRFPDRKRVAS